MVEADERMRSRVERYEDIANVKSGKIKNKDQQKADLQDLIMWSECVARCSDASFRGSSIPQRPTFHAERARA